MIGFIAAPLQSASSALHGARSSAKCVQLVTRPKQRSMIPLQMSVENNSNNNNNSNQGLNHAKTALIATLAVMLGGMMPLRPSINPFSSNSTQQVFVPTALAAAKYSKKPLQEKLSQIAVFAVTNASGQPYLANSDGTNQVGLIFFSATDALKMQKEMLKNPSTADAKIFAMTLDKAIDMVRGAPQPSGIRGPDGKELSMVFRFFPDSDAVKAANDPLKMLKVIMKKNEGIPLFSAKGLTVKKGGDTIKPLFFNLDDLYASWNKLRRSDSSVPARPSIDVEDFIKVIDIMERDDKNELGYIGFVPSSVNIDYLNKIKAGPSGYARMHQNPNSPDM